MPRQVGFFLLDIIPREHRWKIELLKQWETIIGKLKDKVRIEKICDDSIILGVCHPTWAQELFFLLPMLKEKINAVLQKKQITNIRIRTTNFIENKQTVSSPSSKYGTINKGYQNRQIEHNLTIHEHALLQTIKNNELQAVLAQFYLRCKENHQKKGVGDEHNTKKRSWP